MSQAENAFWTDTAERITIVARDFRPAAMEFHRLRLGELGYILEGPITPHTFLLIDDQDEPKGLVNGEKYFVATFVLHK